MVMNISIELIHASMNEWFRQGARKGTDQRLGQWLMNNLAPNEMCPEIFYEEDTTTALMAFIKKYDAENWGKYKLSLDKLSKD
jgi:hypothetical protein